MIPQYLLQLVLNFYLRGGFHVQVYSFSLCGVNFIKGVNDLFLFSEVTTHSS